MRRSLIVLLLAILSLPTIALAQSGREEDTIPTGAVQAELLDIVDGDTFDALLFADNGDEKERVRMIGIDTPETSYAYGNEPECYGEQATRKAESILVAAEEIWLERDEGDRDPNGRLLRYVWYISHVDAKVYLLNEQLVLEGFALAKTYRPNTKYQARLDAAERRAISAAAGMWLACDASVSGDPDQEDEDGPGDAPIDRTKTPAPVEEDAACSFFDMFDEAQEWLLVFPELAESIDSDGDGIACEEYFGFGD